MRRAVLFLHGLISRIFLPPSFRAEFGEELRCSVWARLQSRKGIFSVVRLGLLELSDLPRTAFREWGAIAQSAASELCCGLWLDVRTAVRGLAKAPMWSAIVIATLAVAIGANTAVFSVVNGVLLRPLPFPEQEELVVVRAGLLPDVTPRPDISFSDRGYWHFVEQNRVFEAFGGYKPSAIELHLTGDGAPLSVKVGRMTVSLFELLGVAPTLGRLPTAVEGSPDGPQVVVLSHALWAIQYGSDTELVGRSITLGGSPRVVIGVMPPGYAFPIPDLGVWLPLQLDPSSANFEGHHIEGLGRLAPGATIESAVIDAERLIGRFGELGYGNEWFLDVFNGAATVTPLTERIIGNSRRPLLVLFGTMAIVLLIACGNVANLTLVRAEGRTRENGLRLALGSSRMRLIQQCVVESLLVALVGGVFGCFLAFHGTRALVAIAPAGLPRMDEIGVSWGAMAYTTVISVAVGLLIGLGPAFRSGSRSLAGFLASGGHTFSGGRNRHRTRGLFVVPQIALALILVAGSGLMVRSFEALRSVNRGFNSSGVLTFTLRPSAANYDGAEGVAQFYDQLLERLAAVPGVTSVGAISTLPLQGQGPLGAREIEEFPTVEGEIAPIYHLRRATPGYFEALGIPIVEGRSFVADDHNLRLGSIIISEALKQRFWPATTAVGKRIGGATVVGVVGDVRGAGLGAEIQEMVYSPMLDSVGGGVRSMTLVVATDLEPLAILPDMRRIVGALDSDLPVAAARSMGDVVNASLSRASFTMVTLFLAAMIALFLAAVGIYGVLAYVAACRTSEMGIRLALGADSASVRRLILAQGLTLAAVGTALGLAGAVALGRVLESLLFEVTPSDPLTLGVVALIFMSVALVATLVPALRAGRTSAAEALRTDG